MRHTSSSPARASHRSTPPRRSPSVSARRVSMAEIAIPEDAIEERFLASTGPGGQNVNKVATACQLRVDVFRLGLEPAVYRRLKTPAGSRIQDRKGAGWGKGWVGTVN